MSLNFKDILNNWSLKDYRIFDKKANGERCVYFIQAKGEAFVLKVFSPELTEEYIERYTSALEFVCRLNYKIGPKIYNTLDNHLYISCNGRYMYLMEYVTGTKLTEDIDDEYELGLAAAKLHSISGYNYNSTIDIDECINNMKMRFLNYEFKKEYDEIIDSLPDFKKYKQSFIHTDIGPHNAIKTENGNIVFIDFDDAGIGSTYLDAGYPLITQFVQFNDRIPGQAPPDIERLHFKSYAAKAFYKGYQSITDFGAAERELIFSGAVFMQLMYMPCFGESAVKYMWAILKFALSNKQEIMSALI